MFAAAGYGNADYPLPAFDRSDRDEMPRPGIPDRRERNRAIEPDEATAMADGEREKIEIGELLGPVDAIGISDRRIKQADFVGPELVKAARGTLRKAFDHGPHRQGVRVAGVRHDPDATVLRDRTRRPPRTSLMGEPRDRGFVEGIIRVEERDEDVDVQQCAHQ
jgi:hypothetical protein